MSDNADELARDAALAIEEARKQIKPSRDLVFYPSQSLKKPSREVDVKNEAELIKDIAGDMLKAVQYYTALGVSAIQMGEDVQILVVNRLLNGPYQQHVSANLPPLTELESKLALRDYAFPFVLINPDFQYEMPDKTTETKYVKMDEGCLSLPFVSEKVVRLSLLKHVTGYTIDNNGEIVPVEPFDIDGLSAVIIQHEVDHLAGKMFTDRLTLVRKNAVLRKYRKLRKPENLHKLKQTIVAL